MRHDLTLSVEQVTVTPQYGDRKITVALEGVNPEEVVEQIGSATLLAEIGKEKAISHFNIEEVE